MTDPQWETVEVPRGSYIGWGNRTGQHVTGRVVGYDDRGGTDFNGDPCPQLSVELTERAASFNKEGERTDFDAGELVILNCGQASLKRAVRAAALNTNDLVKVEFVDTEKVDKGTVKVFEIKVARGAGKAAAAASAPARSAAPMEEEPPF